MCGIAGAADFAGRPIDERLVVRMCEAIRHRGPDDQGIMHFPTAALGSRRLSIIDVKGGHQPIANEDRTVWTVLNGELYNYRELRAELEQKGHRFSTVSDTEVIVHLYEERGEDFVAALEGMFALALWDETRHCLLLARDRFGKKPLLYADSDSRIAFASEFQALLADPAVSRELDVEALGSYLSYLSVPAPHSIYRGIRKLPPAHVLVRDRRGTTVRRYWSLPFTPKLEIGEREAAERLLALLGDAVRKRLISEVPLGAFLSGGVDSSAVVALMAKLGGARVKTFSIGFEEAAYNELPHARRVAEAFDCEHHEFVVRPAALEVVPTLVRHFGEPFADSSAIPTYHLSRLTRQHVTVALTGDGGDEGFAGYGRHLAYRVSEAWGRQPGALRTAVARASGLIPDSANSRRWVPRVRRFMEAAALSRAERYRRWVGILSRDFTETLRGTPAAVALDNGIVERLFHEHADLDPVDAALAVDTAFYLPTDLLVKMDITSMASSLEARAPFLDHHLVEFAARLPSHLKLRRLTSKYILKRALEGVVPRENLYRNKRGFAVPIGQWFRGELREFLADHVLSKRFAQRGLFRPGAVETLVADHLGRRADHAHELWTLLMLELWFRAFMDGR
jgi:asparagine synthase (glutamine-hydrolysing)